MDLDTLLNARNLLLAKVVFRAPDFITPDEQAALVAWALPMEQHLVWNGANRTFNRVEDLPGIDPLFHVARQRIERLMGLGANPVPEAKIGMYLSIISAGGLVHVHRDSTPRNTRHLRCNLFLQVPEEGGRPIIGGQEISVAPCMLLAFYPSEMPHASEAFAGAQKRILLSFGYTVPPDHRLPNQDQPPTSA